MSISTEDAIEIRDELLRSAKEYERSARDLTKHGFKLDDPLYLARMAKAEMLRELAESIGASVPTYGFCWPIGPERNYE